MVTVEDYGVIRRAHRDGMSMRAIARQFRRSRRKVRDALASPEPQPYTRTKEADAPKLGPFKLVIDQILADDEEAPRKQRHTAMQVFRRLRKEQGYVGGYDQVRRYIAGHRQRHEVTFIPLSHDPGQRLELDFGHIYADFPDGRRQVPVLIPTWSFSNFAFALGLPTERIEAVLAGMVAAFEFFGCVAREGWWDNPRTVATGILRGRQRQMNVRYAALASHYGFEPLFCMPAAATEKPAVEHKVYDLQRRWCTPVPKVQDHDDLNAYLRRCCLAELDRTCAGQIQTIGQRFAMDKVAALALPIHAFDPCIREFKKVDKFQTVAFDSNRYSVPRRWAFQAVTVKAYVDRIEIVANHQVVARHERCYGRSQQVLDPMHYLVTLGRRPGALDHSGVYRNWQLPASFTQLRAALEQRHGPHAGSRQYIRVLQLLGEHSQARLQQAIEYCRTRNLLDSELIRGQAERLALRQEPAAPDVCAQTPIPQIQVPRADLSQFNQLLSIGEPVHA
ncbi:MAG: IS21 family transposase [Planctomycetota bacterium]